MTIRESTIERIRRLPDSLVREVSEYLDTLQVSGPAGGPEPRDGRRELVARVRSVRGRFARPGAPLASEELHAERHRDNTRTKASPGAPR